MSSLRIYLFGGFRFTLPSYVGPLIQITRSTKALLAYLVLFRHRIHPREVLAGTFWADHSEERARSCLSTALWRIRRLIEPEAIPRGTYLKVMQTGEVGFNQDSDHWIDLAVFEENACQALSQPAEFLPDATARQLEGTIALVTGELLEGFYEDWALLERERIRSLYLKSLAHLLSYYKHHRDYDKGLACGHRILTQDPLREDIHREMIRLYLDIGQRGKAVRQFKTCCKLLGEELGVQPMQETRSLYEAIKSDGIGQSPVGLPFRAESRNATNARGDLEPLLQSLYRAMNHFDKMRDHLLQAIDHLERLTPKRG